jgi:hypothetical protein
MFAGTLGAFLLTPLFLFPSFGSHGDFHSAFTVPRASAEATAHADSHSRVSWGNWWKNADWWDSVRDHNKNDNPHIDAIDPTSVEAGDTVTITGDNFSDETTVTLGTMTMSDVTVNDDGTSLTFTVPDDVDADTYKVRLSDDNGKSNKINLTVTEAADAGLSIDSIDGPAALSVDESGEWTVNVGSESDNLTYSVKWGDEPTGLMRFFRADDEETQSSATFSHTYHDAGTYTPEFTVTDEDGTTVTKTAASLTVGAEDTLTINAIDPMSAAAGDTITLTGTGFDEGAVVRVNGTAAADVSVDGDTITFTAPDLDAGTYRVRVASDGELSNIVKLTITDEADGYVSVSGIDAPTRLAAGEEGTWTVHADTNVDGNLRYGVTWGDEPTGMMRLMSAAELTTQASATFTHTYQDAGTYQPKFVVVSDDGIKASASASVVVSD